MSQAAAVPAKARLVRRDTASEGVVAPPRRPSSAGPALVAPQRNPELDTWMGMICGMRRVASDGGSSSMEQDNVGGGTASFSRSMPLQPLNNSPKSTTPNSIPMVMSPSPNQAKRSRKATLVVNDGEKREKCNASDMPSLHRQIMVAHFTGNDCVEEKFRDCKRRKLL